MLPHPKGTNDADDPTDDGQNADGPRQGQGVAPDVKQKQQTKQDANRAQNAGSPTPASP